MNEIKKIKEKESKCERFNRLEAVQDKARDRLIKVFKERRGEFSKALPKSVSSDSQFVNSLYDQLVHLIDTDIQETFKESFSEWKVREKLLELEKILAEQDKDKGTVAWRPSGDPYEDQVAHDIPVLRNQVQELDQSVLADLHKSVASKHSRIEELQRLIAENNAEIEGFLEKKGN